MQADYQPAINNDQSVAEISTAFQIAASTGTANIPHAIYFGKSTALGSTSQLEAAESFDKTGSTTSSSTINSFKFPIFKQKSTAVSDTE